MCAALRRLRSEGTLAHVGLGMSRNREAHQGVPHEVTRLLREVRSEVDPWLPPPPRSRTREGRKHAHEGQRS